MQITRVGKYKVHVWHLNLAFMTRADGLYSKTASSCANYTDVLACLTVCCARQIME